MPATLSKSTRQALVAALIFAVVALLLQAWRSQVLLASYDQGIFQQVLWNSLRGHPFESTLSSQLSTNVIHSGEPAGLGYARLGQHFTPSLLLWAPLFGLIGGAALPLVQVGLIVSAGLVLHRLALQLVPARTANWLTYGFYGGNALIGPTLGNFTDLCQLPLAVFALMLGLQKRMGWLILSAAVVIPLIREDTGIMLIAIGLWLLLREPKRWPMAIALVIWGAGWMVLVTNALMPLFSDDNSKRFMVENFGQYLDVDPSEGASSLSMVQQALGQPLIMLRELISPPGQTLLYLLGHGLPFLMVPLISLDAWILAGPSLLGLFLAQGSNDPLSITIRYTLLVVPGFSLGTLLWWSRRQQPVPGRRTRLAWGIAISLSLLLTVSSNPHRSLSWIVPDSIKPMVFSSPIQQWRHGQDARQVLRLIPNDASVSANTPLVPLIARREVAVRYPESLHYLDRDKNKRAVDWIAIDLDWLERYSVAFRSDWRELRRIKQELPDQMSDYRVQAIKNGIAVLQHNGPLKPELERQLQERLATPLPPDPRQQADEKS
ncbi:hypothetical protein SynSYN20_03088 [Synechococcus sp. SYN20]|uniref:DUF2079 domain-containing protein n=1 Tax=Synechococcus sp. SYN20 TaxID=1050714 RepID=UPI00164963CA|nr:DUF2079 domain-containing protein [Synechococcus sp. SYN20]QNJ27384.1 hypothetical protein SynSYN20_03088 [Synechococcus sp. SYN20]